MLFADIDCRPCRGRRLAQHVDRKMLGLVPAKRVRGDALVGERFRHVADGELVCSQGEHLALPALVSPMPIRPTLPDVCAASQSAGRSFPGLTYIKRRATLVSHKRRRCAPERRQEAFVAAMRRIAIWAGALIFGVAALAGFRYYDVARPWIQANLPAWIGGGTSADFIIVSGNIEAHESVVSFKTRAVAHRRAALRRGRAGEGGHRARPRRRGPITSSKS